MEYSKCSSGVHSNHPTNSVQFNSDTNQTNDSGSISQTKMFDEKQNYQYRQNNPVSSLNQLLQNNQHSNPYSNANITPPLSSYHSSYKNMDTWNVSTHADTNNKSFESADSGPKSDINSIPTSGNTNVNANEKSEFINNGVCYNYENKNNQSHFKQSPQLSYDNGSYGQIIMNPNNYYNQFRYSTPQQQMNTQNYINPNNPHLTNSVNRPPMSYSGYIQTSSPGPGYAYHSAPLPQIRPFNVHSPYVSRSSQSPYPSETFTNGISSNVSLPKDSSEKHDPVNNNSNQENSSLGSVSNKSATIRSSNSRSKNNSKNESHPATPGSNNVPSPSQTSMSSIMDENEDSVSSIGACGGRPSSTDQQQQPSNQMITQPQQQPQPVVPNSMVSVSGPTTAQPQHHQYVGQPQQMTPQTVGPPGAAMMYQQHHHQMMAAAAAGVYPQHIMGPGAGPAPPYGSGGASMQQPSMVQPPPQVSPRPSQFPTHPTAFTGGPPGVRAPAPAYHHQAHHHGHHQVSHPQQQQQQQNSVYQKLMELGNEPDRAPWLERYLRFMQDNNTPLTAVPTVVKQPLDLYRLYHAVRERGGLLNVVKTKRWKEICLIVNVNASASGAYTLRRNYIKCLLDFECKFDRNGADPGPILQEIQSLSDKKKKSSSRNSGSSPSTLSSGQCSNSEYPGGSGPSTPRPGGIPPQPHDYNSQPQQQQHPFATAAAGGAAPISPYNNVIHNGSAAAAAAALMHHHHRSSMHYPPPPRIQGTGHNPVSTAAGYPGHRSGYGGSPVNPMLHPHHHHQHPNMRYDTAANMQQQQQNWNKSLTMNQHQWTSPISNSNQVSHSMPMPMSPGSTNSTSQTMGVFPGDSGGRRVDWKSNYGGMPPPPPPPPNAQPVRPPNLPPNMPPHTSQIGPIICNNSNAGVAGAGMIGGIGQQQQQQQYHSGSVIPPHSVGYLSTQHQHQQQLSHSTSTFNNQARLNSSCASTSNNASLPTSIIPTNRTSTSNNLNNSLSSDSLTFSNKQTGNNSSAMTTPIQSMSNFPNRSHHLENSRVTQSYQLYSKSNCGYLKRYEHLFPSDCVEATQPDLNKKRRYTNKDIKTFNPTLVTMMLKSGLICETSWVLNCMTIWSRDDAVVDKMNLKSLMPLFQALLELWRNTLSEIFGRALFIDDLELPLLLDSTLCVTEIKSVLNRVDKLLRCKQNRQQKEENKDVSEEERIINLLDGDKYSNDRRGLAVKLDYNCRLETAICSERNFAHTLLISATQDMVKKSSPDLLKKLWAQGGSDCTEYVSPPIWCQYRRLYSNGCKRSSNMENDQQTPEVKRSRLDEKNNSTVLTNEKGSVPLSVQSEEHDDEQLNSSLIKSNFVDEDVIMLTNDVADTLFLDLDDAKEEQMLRCISVSTILRNLSFLAGNDRLMAQNKALLRIVGRLLLLEHVHGNQNDSEKSPWWLRWLDDLREHALVTLVNVSSFLEFEQHEDCIVRPLMIGLLHWLTCSSATAADDPLPSHRVLGCRRLALEALMRLCVHERNCDFILNTTFINNGNSHDSLVLGLFNYLATAFCHPEVQVVKEMALAVMHYLSQAGEGGIGAIYLASARPSVIGGLINFIEITESQIRHVVDNMGMEALQARPELMGTSLEFLRHSGALLNRLAAQPANRNHFSRDHEMRMLNLVISTVLDQTVAQSISGVLYLLSKHSSQSNYLVQQHNLNPSFNLQHNSQVISEEVSETDGLNDNKNTPVLKLDLSSKFKSFLTFNDLSFCEKDSQNNTLNSISNSNNNSAENEDIKPNIT